VKAPSSFVGRADDLAALETSLETRRWTTVVGPPGVGKTRLVDELIARVRAREAAPPGGIWSIDLGSARTPLEAGATIASVLGVADGTTLLARTAATLAGQGPAWVVLHDADGVASEVPAIVTALLAGAPDLHVVVTSRVRSASEGEVAFDVQPLDATDAIQLFVERATAVRRDFALASCEADVRRLVDALDRLPLAIELAAARTRVMTPAQLVERPGLVFGDAGRDRLRAALDAAWEGLTAEQQATLVQLAVFRGGFDLDAATAVVELAPGDTERVVEALAALRDASLVITRQTEDGLRFELLAIVREYLRARPASAGLEARHARCLLERGRGLVQRLDGSDARVARRQLASEQANLRAVGPVAEAKLEAAILVATLQIRSGSYRELTDVLASSLAGVEPGRRPELVAEAWWLRGEALRQAGELDEAERSYTRAAEIAAAANHVDHQARAGYGLAAIAFSRGELTRAVERYRRDVVERAGISDPVTVTRGLCDLGVIQTALGQPAEARAAFDRALREARVTRCVTGEGKALIGLGQLEQQAGRLDEARSWFVRALEIHELVGDDRSTALAHLQLGLNHHLRGELEPAAQRYRTARAISAQIGHRLLEAIVVCALGSCVHAQGALDEARRHFEHASAAFEHVGHASYRAVAVARLAALRADQGELEEARGALELASALIPAGIDREVAEGIAMCRAHVELAAGGDPAVARGLVEAARTSPVDVRVQARVLAHRLDGWTPTSRTLAIGTRARWFSIDQHERVSLERRGPPSRILAALVDHRRAAPNEVITPDELFARGWPGQRISTESAAQRVYTAIWTLRTLGLRDVIVRVADGYFLDPAIAVVDQA
jgi:predicted ATPase